MTIEKPQDAAEPTGAASALSAGLERLLPCPFCGSEDVVLTHMSDEYEYVMCTGCGVSAVSNDTLPERTPTKAWNMRANVQGQETGGDLSARSPAP